MKRPFTTREKVMILLLTLMIIGMGYYRLILEPINTSVQELNTMVSEEESAILQDMSRMQSMKLMEEELEEIFAQGDPTPIPSYDNVGVIITELHAILDGTVDYRLSFSPVGAMSGGYLVSRGIDLTFTADSYAQARTVFNRLHESVNINQISNLSMTANGSPDQEEGGIVTVTMHITYFELIA